MGDLLGGCLGVIAYGIAGILLLFALLLALAAMGVMLAFAAPVFIVVGFIFVLFFIFAF